MLINAVPSIRSTAPLLRATALSPLCTVAGCLVDGDRCGPNQTLRGGLCGCVEGAVVANNQCVIIDAGAPPPAAGQSAACGPTTPCGDSTFAHCQQTPSGEGYCTATGCTSSADCTNAFQCVTGASPSYCRRPYTGQEAPCTSSTDCAKYDANFCSTTVGVCLIRDCTADSCDPGYVCFDPSQFIPGAPKVCINEENVP